MARTRRRAGTALIKRLLREPHRFDFFQAVRLLEWMQPGREPTGAGLGPGREAMRFRADPSLAFPASDIVGIAPPREVGDVPEVTVSFLGLTGTNGPLPRPFTELVLERAARKDTAMRDFLDLFHHRLISLLYRVRKKARVSLHAGAPDEAEVADQLFAMVGLGTLGVRGRMDVPDRSLLRYTGLLTQRPRSMHGLERILADYFSVPVKGRPFIGRWVALEPDQRTSLGAFGQNAVLGESAVLGARVWDQQSKFELVIGPLTLHEFIDFLPGSDRLPKLVSLTRFYVGPDLEFDVRLKLRTDEVPGTRLGASPGPRLGWTSWLRKGDFEGVPEIVIRDPEAANPSADAMGDDDDRAAAWETEPPGGPLESGTGPSLGSFSTQGEPSGEEAALVPQV